MNPPWDLIDAHFDGELSPEQEAKLAAWLADDHDHVRLLVREAHLRTCLRTEMALLSRPVAAAVAAQSTDGLVRSPSTLSIWRHRSWEVASRARSSALRRSAETGRLNAGLRTWNMRLPLALAASLALLLALSVWFLGPPMGRPVLTAVEGDVRLGRIGQPSLAAATPGTLLQAGDALLTGSNSTVTITFGQEPTRLDLGAEAALSLTGLAGGKRFDLRSGSLDAAVARQRPFAPLVVTTPNATATVLGTRFTVTATSNRTRLDVTEGSVRLADTLNPTNPAVKVRTGHYAVVAAKTALAVLPQTGGLLMEHWTNVTGAYHVNYLRMDSRYPDHPNLRTNLSKFEAPSNVGEQFGARFRGYIHPPETGPYTFALAAWDGAELFLGRDDQPGNAVQIAYAEKSGPREWTKHRGQQSSALTLVAGKRYYIEAIQKQSTGADHLAVAWKRPGRELEVISGDFLSPFKPK